MSETVVRDLVVGQRRRFRGRFKRRSMASGTPKTGSSSQEISQGISTVSRMLSSASSELTTFIERLP